MQQLNSSSPEKSDPEEDPIVENIKSIIHELKDPSDDFQLVDEEEEFQDLALEEEKAPEFKVEEEE